MSTDYVSRPLSPRESQIVGWLEEERIPAVNAQDLMDAFALDRPTASDVLRRMAAKGWLQRVSQGSYEPLLADSGGIALPNPWAALSTWRKAYYVSYASSAYELDLTPDRPGSVQVCVPAGVNMPVRFAELSVSLINQRHFSKRGAEKRSTHGVDVQLAGLERTLIDSAIRPARVGGTIALGRIVYRASAATDWEVVRSLAAEHPRGVPGMRRVAALMDLLGLTVPKALADAARAGRPGRPMLLDDASIYGWGGPTDKQFGVVLNVPVEAIQEEVRR